MSSRPLRKLTFVATATLSFILLVVACDSADEKVVAPFEDAGTSDAKQTSDAKVDSGGGKDAASCLLHAPYTKKNIPCNDCAQENCCNQINACLDETECNDDYVNCILACALEKYDASPDSGDPTASCRAACGKSFPKGEGLYGEFSLCVDATCGSICH